ncbi:MAG: fibronectin type III domain-containing protein, partial [Verrucomicrobiae bacterium]|nr:fibronectin type III domain-containing protein [Verrucomicrobiae bacterium]
MKKFLCSCLLLSVLPAAAERGPVPGFSTADPYLIYYGNWDAGKVDAARTNYRMVILHPTSNITPADIATIRRGPDNVASTSDDVHVLAYISVGEDDRPGAPFTGDGNGPRIDPRNSENDPLEGISALGDPSTGGTGYASYYLDDDDFDGEPDMNPTFGGPYVNPGDPAWFQVIKNNVKSVDGVAGLDEIMTTTTGLGYGCDGVFLDTLDTPAPNSFGATYYEWTAPAYQQLVKDISDAYPGKLLLGNRGLFFYNPNLKTYNYTLRPYLNLILFESYFTDSSGSGVPSAYFSDNKFNFAPKLNAEADRADGFTVLCLGYTTAGEPPALGEQDFVESQQVQGWPLYRTNPSLDAAFNTDAATWNATHPDTSPPEWDSTLAYGGDYDPGTPGDQPAPPRVGILQVVPGDGNVIVRWDVARDQTGPVAYNIYYTDQPTLDFNTAVKLAAVAPSVPVEYATSGAIPGTSASEYTVTGLSNGTTYQFAVRAEDGLAQEETNTVTLAATPQGIASDFRSIAIDGSFADWSGAAVLDSDPAEATVPDFAEVSVANDADYLYVRFTLHSAAGAFVDFNSHLFIDTDDNPATGFTPGGTTFGSELMIEGASGYDQRAGGFNDGSVSGVAWSIANDGGPVEYELRLSRSAIYGNDSQPVFGGNVIRLLLQHNAGDVTSSIRYQFAPAPPPPSEYATINVDGDFSDWTTIPEILSDPSGDGIPDIVSVKAANDGDYLYLYVEYAAATDTNTFNSSPSTYVSLDNDDNPATGFDIYSLGEVGAEVSWQNDVAFSQSAGVYNSGGTFTGAVPGIAPYASNTTAQEYRIALNATYDTGGGSQPVFPQDIIRLALWTDDGGSAEFAGAFRYQLADPPPPPGYFAAIQVDGDASEWASIPALVTDPSGDGAPDIVSVKAANDDDWLYLLVEY